MPVLVKCRRCGARIVLGVKRKAFLPPVFRVRCPSCGYEDVYTVGDAWEEGVYTFVCPVCGKKFFIVREPPIDVVCPHCNSILRIISTNEPPIAIKRGRPLSAIPLTALLGALLGLAMSKKDRVSGAVAGGLLGAVLGALIDALSGYEREAKYLE